MNNNKTQISKTMSWVLRHGLNELGLKPDNIGRIPLKTLLELDQLKSLNVNEQIVFDIVKSNDKQRFNLEQVDGEWLIGANQGHSKDIGSKINSDLLMDKITTPVELCVHGTYSNVIEQIKKTGLKRMERTHIHFASGYPSDQVISGARKSANVFVELDMKKAMDDGIIFYRSSNGVILSEGKDGVIEPKYFANIVYK